MTGHTSPLSGGWFTAGSRTLNSRMGAQPLRRFTVSNCVASVMLATLKLTVRTGAANL